MIEYECLMQMEKKKTEKDDGATADYFMDDCNVRNGLLQVNTKKVGRQSSLRFEYNMNLEIQRVFQQQLAAKQSVAFVIGKAPPKRSGKRPLQLNEESFCNYEKRLDSWHKGNFFRCVLLAYFSGQSLAKTSEKVNLPLKFINSGLQTAMLPRIGWTNPVLLCSLAG
jgi:hypothetical protein